jgi:hypothetical protein
LSFEYYLKENPYEEGHFEFHWPGTRALKEGWITKSKTD